MSSVTEEQLKARGFRRGFEEIVEEAEEMTAWVISGMPVGRGMGDAKGELTAEEGAALERGGLDLSLPDPGAQDPLARTAATYAAMLAAGLTTEEVAKMLEVSEEYVRRRLSERTLYGIKTGRGYRLPAFQFAGGGEVPGIGRVLRTLDPGLHPVEVLNWLTLPDADLYLDEEEKRPVSPREWLLSGGSPEALVPLAGDL